MKSTRSAAMRGQAGKIPTQSKDRIPRTSAAISLIAVDDRPLMMSGIDSTLMHEPDIKLVAKINTADESLAAIDKFRPDVVLLKLRMSATSALDIIEMLRKAESKTRPVILAGRMTHEEFMRAMQLGVRGVFSTAMTASLLPRCLRVVHAGEEFIDRDVWRRTFEILARRPAAASAGILKLLTSREQSVAELAVSGWGNSQIARKLSITEGTVKVHLHRVYSKLEIKGRSALAELIKDNSPV